MGIKTLKLVHFSNEFPYDDQQTVFREILLHSKDRNHDTLARFLQEATIAIREEFVLLPSALKTSIPTFESIFDFVDFADARKGPLGGSIDGVLLCIVELGSLIGCVLVSKLAMPSILNAWVESCSLNRATLLLQILRRQPSQVENRGHGPHRVGNWPRRCRGCLSSSQSIRPCSLGIPGSSTGVPTWGCGFRNLSEP